MRSGCEDLRGGPREEIQGADGGGWSLKLGRERQGSHKRVGGRSPRSQDHRLVRHRQEEARHGRLRLGVQVHEQGNRLSQSDEEHSEADGEKHRHDLERGCLHETLGSSQYYQDVRHIRGRPLRVLGHGDLPGRRALRPHREPGGVLRGAGGGGAAEHPQGGLLHALEEDRPSRLEAGELPTDLERARGQGRPEDHRLRDRPRLSRAGDDAQDEDRLRLLCRSAGVAVFLQ
mmetsp:Transcript_142444/g.354991  ORF Transcript_142444/g.354991 Transcript_142444/m.354991 type:complete len:231 (+) Transcript_142444:390-1082(+)